MSKLRIAIVGCGYWGQNLVRNFADLPNVEIAAAYDFNLIAMARTKHHHPGLELKRTFQEVVTDPRIHAIVIATPALTHYPFARQALEAGKHVLVEKPLATSADQVLDVMEIADRRDRVLMVDHTFVYTPAVREMRSLIDAGKIGNLLYFDSVRISLGLVQSDINVIWDLGPHDFSILDYLCREDPIAISAVARKHVGSPFENIAYVTAYFGSQMIAHLHLNWLAQAKVRKIMVVGTKKALLYDDLETAEKVRVYDNEITIRNDSRTRERSLAGYRNGDMFVPNLDTSEALGLVARDFVDSIAQQRMPHSDGYTGYRVVRLLEAAQRSMELNGEPIELPNPMIPRRTIEPELAAIA